MLLSRLLKHAIVVGTLNVIDAYDKTHVFSGKFGPEVTIRLHKRSLHTKLFFNPDLYVGEAYMDGTLTIEEGTLVSFLEILTTNLKLVQAYPFHAVYESLSLLMRGWHQYNPLSRARRHVAHHYDLPDQLFEQFLDPDRQYSCAYFQNTNDTLETAQAKKQRHLAAKLLLEPGHRVLDIGSGWGGLALYLARVAGSNVTGLTLSVEQMTVANRRAAKSGLADRASFHVRDYREEVGTYDRIVSVGMFEHVGVNHYPEFFSSLGKMLKDDGVCVIHTIGRVAGPSTTCAWIRKYIFPGGYSPALSETVSAVEASGLWVTDIEVLRLHYAETLLAWRRRFQANRTSIAKRFGERFCRMWEFYLNLSEAAFRHGDHVVFQLQLAKRRDAVPLTRDYITAWENAHTVDALPSRQDRAA